MSGDPQPVPVVQPALPGAPAEGAEVKFLEPLDDPERRYATPAFRVEPTTENDPRKGR